MGNHVGSLLEFEKNNSLIRKVFKSNTEFQKIWKLKKVK